MQKPIMQKSGIASSVTLPNLRKRSFQRPYNQVNPFSGWRVDSNGGNDGSLISDVHVESVRSLSCLLLTGYIAGRWPSESHSGKLDTPVQCVSSRKPGETWLRHHLKERKILNFPEFIHVFPPPPFLTAHSTYHSLLVPDDEHILDVEFTGSIVDFNRYSVKIQWQIGLSMSALVDIYQSLVVKTSPLPIQFFINCCNIGGVTHQLSCLFDWVAERVVEQQFKNATEFNSDCLLGINVPNLAIWTFEIVRMSRSGQSISLGWKVSGRFALITQQLAN